VAPVMKYMTSSPKLRSAATKPATEWVAFRPARSPMASVTSR